MEGGGAGGVEVEGGEDFVEVEALRNETVSPTLRMVTSSEDEEAVADQLKGIPQITMDNARTRGKREPLLHGSLVNHDGLST